MARAKGQAKATPKKAGKSSSNRKTGSQFQALVDTNQQETSSPTLVTPKPQRSAKDKRPEKREQEQTPQARAAKCLRDNFNGWSEYRLYKNKVQGITLYEYVLRDKTLEFNGDPDAPSFGKNYFTIVRKLFEGKDDVVFQKRRK